MPRACPSTSLPSLTQKCVCGTHRGTQSKKHGLNVEKRSWDSVTAALIKGLYYQRCALEETPGNTPILPAIRPLRLIGSSDFSRSSFVFYCVTALKYLLFSSFSTISA